MLAAAAVPAFAAAPSAYDGQPYESVGYTSDDPDGEINLAVIAKGKVDIVGDAMYIEGSVYSNDTIYVGNGGGNKVDGIFISGVKGMWDYKAPGDGATEDQYRLGYIHVDDDHQMTTNAYSTTLDYEGAILDTETSFECSYEDFEVPEIANKQGTVQMNVYGNSAANNLPQTVTEDTYFEKIEMNGTQNNWQNLPAGLIVDTTAGDVTVVINELAGEWGQPAANPSIEVVGDNDAYIYINNVSNLNNLSVNYDTGAWPPVFEGNSEKTHLYLSGDSINFGASYVAVADMHVNANSLTVSGSTKIYGDIYSGAEDFVITGGETEVHGIVCVPNADSRVVDSGTLYGQLHTDTLTINGAGRILWKPDKKPAPAEKTEPTPEPTVEPTPEPTVEPTPEPTLEPLPTGEPLELTGGYAYIFGYEPDKIQQVWVDDEEGGHTAWDIEVRMAPEDAVTREQVAAMIMRMIDQSYDTKDADYPLTPNMTQHAGAWYERGLAYLASKGTFDGVESVDIGPVTRGEVAKLVVCGLNLTDTTETSFADIADSPYKQYIEIMNAYGYMHGDSETEFRPDEIMNRAEFCSMFNNIIGRNDMGLTAQDGSTVTAETYYFVDLPADEWYTDIMLKATSAYDGNGLIDVDTRLENIRNTLDHYDSQNIA